MGKRGRQPYLPVYQFDLEGNLIYMHKTLDVAVENLLISKATISAAMRQKSCYHRKWYFSRMKNFVVPIKKTNQNPLLSKKPGKIGLPDLPEIILPDDSSEEFW